MNLPPLAPLPAVPVLAPVALIAAVQATAPGALPSCEPIYYVVAYLLGMAFPRGGQARPPSPPDG